MPKWNYKIKGKVWLYPGMSGWHFIALSKKDSAKIRKQFGKGLIKIQAKVGKSFWPTSLLPDTRTETYLIALKARVREVENIREGDEIKLEFKILRNGKK